MELITETYGRNAKALGEMLASAWTDSMLDQEIEMYGLQWKRGNVLTMLITHQAHHRGQMTVLMRQAGLEGRAKKRWRKTTIPDPELEVERELGLATKADIEAYGIEAFNQRCRESVQRYVEDWSSLTSRSGTWIDTADAYSLDDSDFGHNEELIAEKYRGIRPAFGYPACPEHTEKAKLFSLLHAEKLGIHLTESFAMLPAASVSGIYLAHPRARYFALGRIGRDQVEDYARRKGMGIEEVERWLAPYLAYEPADIIAATLK